MSEKQQPEDNKAQIIEAAILTAGEPVTIDRLIQLFPEESLTKKDMVALLGDLANRFEDRGIELKEVASGYRFQAKQAYAPWLQRLWEKKPPRYTRALMETLALVVYKQPITRGEIEDVRGVAVSTNIMKTLMDHEWIKIVGYKEVPGKPALFATTKKFLDYFNLKELSELPPLEEIANLDVLGEQLGEQLKLAVNETLDIAVADGEQVELIQEDQVAIDEALDDELAALAEEIKPTKPQESEDTVSEDEDYPQEAYA